VKWSRPQLKAILESQLWRGGWLFLWRINIYNVSWPSAYNPSAIGLTDLAGYCGSSFGGYSGVITWRLQWLAGSFSYFINQKIQPITARPSMALWNTANRLLSIQWLYTIFSNVTWYWKYSCDGWRLNDSHYYCIHCPLTVTVSCFLRNILLYLCVSDLSVIIDPQYPLTNDDTIIDISVITGWYLMIWLFLWYIIEW